MYSKETIDHVHDTLIDLIISCMKTYKIPLEKPEVGDWCIEMSSVQDHDNSVGRLIKKYEEQVTKDYTDMVYEIELVGGKIVTWRNALFYKIPSESFKEKRNTEKTRVKTSNSEVRKLKIEAYREC